MKKKGKSPRRQLAEKLYKDPKSETFMKKEKSVAKAGYSPVVAKHDSSKILVDTNFTDAELDKAVTFIGQKSKVDQLLWKKLEELAEDDKISAKDYSNLLHQRELQMKREGLLKQYIEKKVAIVNIGIPRQICRKCGEIMDYMKEGEE